MRAILASLVSLLCLTVLGQVPPRVMDELLLAASPIVAAETFSPTTIDGLVAWYQVSAANYVTNSNVAELTDLSGNGITLTNADNNGSQPTRLVSALNGHDTLFFTGAGSPYGRYLQNTGYTNVNGVESLVLVVKPTGAALGYFVDGTSASNRRYFRNNAATETNLPIVAFIGASLAAVTTTNTWSVLTAIFNNTTSDIYTNNVQAASGNAGSNTLAGIRIGLRYGAQANPMAGEIAELLVYNRAITEGERTELFDYLTARYGL